MRCVTIVSIGALCVGVRDEKIRGMMRVRVNWIQCEMKVRRKASDGERKEVGKVGESSSSGRFRVSWTWIFGRGE